MPKGNWWDGDYEFEDDFYEGASDEEPEDDDDDYIDEAQFTKRKRSKENLVKESAPASKNPIQTPGMFQYC